MWATAWRAVVGTVVLIVMMLANLGGIARASGPRGAAGNLITSAQVVKMLAEGRSFRADHVRIRGDLNLNGLSRVKGSFRCRSCTFEGSLTASDAEFRDVVDLAGSHIRGGINMMGAIFDRSVIFTGAIVDGDARFDTTVFAPSASFDNMTFGGTSSFSGARFRGDATFQATDFTGQASFSGATFLGDALFGGLSAGKAPGAASAKCAVKVAGAFAGRAVFAAVTFHGRADFSGRCFAGVAGFSGITVTGRTDFDAARFVGTAIFEGAGFGDDASFTLATFQGDARFAGVSAQRNLTFEAADFGSVLDLDGAAIGGTLSLTTPFLPAALDIDGAILGGLVLDPRDSQIVGTCTLLPCTQVTILQKIEETARAAGDTATANDARFDWLQVAGQARLNSVGRWRIPWIWTWLQDRVLYRWVAGYLVRPLSPALVFAALWALGIIVRIFRRPKLAKPAGDQPGSGTPASQPVRQQDPAAQAAGTTAGATRAGSEQGEVSRANPSQTTTRAPIEPPAGRGRRDLSHWIQAFLDAGAVAFSPRPPKQLKEATRDPDVSGLAVVAVRWLEFAGFKALTVLIFACVANYNQTLHQLIDSIVHL